MVFASFFISFANGSYRLYLAFQCWTVSKKWFFVTVGEYFLNHIHIRATARRLAMQPTAIGDWGV